MVTVTANRSAPTQLATVKWDDEGVEPVQSTLVKDGVLTDFQTTREQASWLAPYYEKAKLPVKSHGYAAAEDALSITMQHMPNLALEPNPSPVRLDDLIANVKDGILITSGSVQTDHQARNGTIGGGMRKISDGRLGAALTGASVQFNTTDIWKHVVSIGGADTRGVIASTALNYKTALVAKWFYGAGKGQPVQMTSHSVSGVAATITNQPLIDLRRKA